MVRSNSICFLSIVNLLLHMTHAVAHRAYGASNLLLNGGISRYSELNTFKLLLAYLAGYVLGVEDLRDGAAHVNFNMNSNQMSAQHGWSRSVGR